MDARSDDAGLAAKKLPKRDRVVPGLILRIGKKRSTWCLICRLPGKKPSRHKIGDAALMTRTEARAEALRWKAAIAQGRDPAVRQVSREASFGMIADQYFEDCRRRGLRRAHEVARDCRRIFQPWWSRTLSALDRADLLHLIAQHRGYAAHHAFSYASRLFSWCVERGLLVHSPCYRLRPSRLIGEKRPRERILSPDELRALWVVAPPFVRMLILTGQRLGEVAGMRWDEIHNDVWTIPASRMTPEEQRAFDEGYQLGCIHGAMHMQDALMADMTRLRDLMQTVVNDYHRLVQIDQATREEPAPIVN